MLGNCIVHALNLQRIHMKTHVASMQETFHTNFSYDEAGEFSGFSLPKLKSGRRFRSHVCFLSMHPSL